MFERKEIPSRWRERVTSPKVPLQAKVSNSVPDRGSKLIGVIGCGMKARNTHLEITKSSSETSAITHTLLLTLY